MKLEDKYRYINLPKQYWGAKYEQIQPENLHIADPWKMENVRDRSKGKGMYLFGKYGRGKGTLCAIIAKWALGYGIMSYWTTLDQIHDLIMSDKSKPFSSTMSVLERINSVDLLIIDEFQLIKSKNGVANWRAKFLEDLLRSRVYDAKPTIMASNISPKLLAEKFKGDAEGLIAFLPEAFEIHLVKGEDLRRKK